MVGSLDRSGGGPLAATFCDLISTGAISGDLSNILSEYGLDAFGQEMMFFMRHEKLRMIL